MKKQKVIIVGAGPGGLTAGMILSSKGYEVEIYEKNSFIGGRNGAIEENGYKFDIGPTFLMLKPILEEVFKLSEEKLEKWLKFHDLDPMYDLVFKDKSLKLSPDHEKTRKEINKAFPGEINGFDKLMKKEKARFKAAFPCLKKDYSTFRSLFNKDLIKFLPKLSPFSSMHDELGKYFNDEDLKMAFTFQSKYLGMSPWDCPAVYMMIPYIEHNFGIQHVEGGLSEISEAMGKVIKKNGGRIFLDNEVFKIKSNSIILKNGDEFNADHIITNVDVGHNFKHLMEEKKDLSNKDFSCSTYMLYLGIEGDIDLEHHTVFFSDDYKEYVDSIFKDKKLNKDISFYVRNASKIDKTLAPKGHSNIYILVPTPNNKSKIDWQKESKKMRELVLKKLKEKTGEEIKDRIKYEKIITPEDWEKEYSVFLGATFNLSHKLTQMLYFRPHNQQKNGVLLVGGGTNPGSGLPTIYESGRIAADIILSRKVD